MQTINDLRAVLFETLHALRDEKNPMEIERAKAICETAQTIISTAKTEVEFMRVSGSNGTGFLETTRLPALEKPNTPQKTLTSTGQKTVTEMPGVTITQHRIS